MYIKQKKSWEISENESTSESLYLNRRKLLQAAGLAGAGLMIGGTSSFAAPIGGFPPARNPKYTLDRAITSEQVATTYTTFFEFGSSNNNEHCYKMLH